MKKLLLPVLFLSASMFANAQDCAVGNSTNGAFEDFSSADPAVEDVTTGYGFYEWGGEVHTVARNTETGMLDITVNQPFNQFEPFGFNFGDSNGAENGGTEYTIDMSNSTKTFKVVITNNSDTAIYVRASLKDIDGNILDIHSGAESDAEGTDDNPATTDVDEGTQYTPYSYEIGVTIAAGETGTLAGTFEGAYRGNYDANGTGLPYTNLFDFENVTNFQLTPVSAYQDVTNDYKRYAVLDKLISIDEITIGQCKIATGTFSAAPAAIEGVFPNPATEVATVNYSASSNAVVTVADLAGNIVRTVNGSASTASVNVADLATGIYVVTVSENGTPVSNHKLVVK